MMKFVCLITSGLFLLCGEFAFAKEQISCTESESNVSLKEIKSLVSKSLKRKSPDPDFMYIEIQISGDNPTELSLFQNRDKKNPDSKVKELIQKYTDKTYQGLSKVGCKNITNKETNLYDTSFSLLLTSSNCRPADVGANGMLAQYQCKSNEQLKALETENMYNYFFLQGQFICIKN